MLNTFIFSFFTGIQQRKIVAIVYFFQFCLALTLGLQVMSVLEASIGNSLEINKLLLDYDHTVFMDFLKTHGASLSPLLGQLRWILLVYLLFAVFIDAGLLLCAIKPDEASPQTFWQGGATYFFPFLKMFFVFFTLAGVWTALVFLPVLSFFQPALTYFSSEKYVVWGLFFLVLLYLLGLSFLFLGSVASRYWKMKTNETITTSIKNGFRIFLQHKTQFWQLLGLVLSLQIALFLAYQLIASLLGMTSPVGVVFIFLIQQIFSFLRVMTRQMLYVGIVKIGSLN